MSESTDSRQPFGTYAPSSLQSLLMTLGHKMPPTWAGRRVVSLIRSILKRWSERPIDAVRLGSRMRLYANGNANEKRLITSPQLFDPVELAVLEKALGPTFVFVDVGANAGAYTLFVATRVGRGGRIVAVEPHPTVRQRLQCNLDLNDVDWVTIAPVALADHSGTLSLFINDRNIGGSSLDDDPTPGIAKRSFEVPCQTLLELIEQQGLERIDAIKIDVEGVEDRILVPFFASAPAGCWPQLLLIEDNRGVWKDDLPAVLQRSGYATVVATGGNLVLRRGDRSSRNGAV